MTHELLAVGPPQWGQSSLAPSSLVITTVGSAGGQAGIRSEHQATVRRPRQGPLQEFTEGSPRTYLVIIDRPQHLVYGPESDQVVGHRAVLQRRPITPENLASLAQNASPDIEFVLVDDGSTDATSSILADGAERLRGSQLLRLGQDADFRPRRNAGLSAARGRFSAFSTATMSLLRATFWHCCR